MSGPRSIPSALRAWLNSPQTELTRFQRTVTSAVALAFHCARQLRRDRAQQMAAALAYRTIFGLIPTLVLSLIVLRFFYADSISTPLHRLINYVGLDQLAIPTGDAASGGAGEARVSEWIESLVARVSSLNFAAIGVVGVTVLIYAALSLMAQVEHAFNTIYKAQAGRSVVAKVTQYWTILTLGPMGVLGSFWISDRGRDALGGVGSGRVFSSLGVIPALAMSWLVLLLVFMVIPHTRVRLRPALVGSFVAAALWEIGKWGFALYLGFSTGYARFYGSLGLIPIFMLWIYLTWLIVLFGLELSYALQTLDRGLASFRSTPTAPDRPDIDPAAGVALLAAVAESFEQGDSLTAAQLATTIARSSESVQAAIGVLQAAGFVHPVEQSDDGPTKYTLAKPPDKIELRAVASALAVESANQSSAAGKAAEVCQSATQQGLGDQTLATLLKEKH